MKQRTRIRPVSSRRRKALAIYAKIKRVWLANHPWCEVTGIAATEVHHRRGRIGTLLIDTRFWMAVSFRVHRLIHDHPTTARAEGWLAGPGKWNVPPRDSETERLKDLLR
jgi:hypothetical protein